VHNVVATWSSLDVYWDSCKIFQLKSESWVNWLRSDCVNYTVFEYDNKDYAWYNENLLSLPIEVWSEWEDSSYAVEITSIWQDIWTKKTFNSWSWYYLACWIWKYDPTQSWLNDWECKDIITWFMCTKDIDWAVAFNDFTSTQCTEVSWYWIWKYLESENNITAIPSWHKCKTDVLDWTWVTLLSENCIEIENVWAWYYSNTWSNIWTWFLAWEYCISDTTWSINQNTSTWIITSNTCNQVANCSDISWDLRTNIWPNYATYDSDTWNIDFNTASLDTHFVWANDYECWAVWTGSWTNIWWDLYDNFDWSVLLCDWLTMSWKLDGRTDLWCVEHDSNYYYIQGLTSNDKKIIIDENDFILTNDIAVFEYSSKKFKVWANNKARLYCDWWYYASAPWNINSNCIESSPWFYSPVWTVWSAIAAEEWYYVSWSWASIQTIANAWYYTSWTWSLSQIACWMGEYQDLEWQWSCKPIYSWRYWVNWGSVYTLTWAVATVVCEEWYYCENWERKNIPEAYECTGTLDWWCTGAEPLTWDIESSWFPLNLVSENSSQLNPDTENWSCEWVWWFPLEFGSWCSGWLNPDSWTWSYSFENYTFPVDFSDWTESWLDWWDTGNWSEWILWTSWLWESSDLSWWSTWNWEEWWKIWESAIWEWTVAGWSEGLDWWETWNNPVWSSTSLVDIWDDAWWMKEYNWKLYALAWDWNVYSYDWTTWSDSLRDIGSLSRMIEVYDWKLYVWWDAWTIHYYDWSTWTEKNPLMDNLGQNIEWSAVYDWKLYAIFNGWDVNYYNWSDWTNAFSLTNSSYWITVYNWKLYVWAWDWNIYSYDWTNLVNLHNIWSKAYSMLSYNWKLYVWNSAWEIYSYDSVSDTWSDVLKDVWSEAYWISEYNWKLYIWSKEWYIYSYDSVSDTWSDVLKDVWDYAWWMWLYNWKLYVWNSAWEIYSYSE
jgi:hypothetical protein